MFKRNLRATTGLAKLSGICFAEGDPAEGDPGAGTGTGTGAETPWTTGLDAEVVGVLQTKGWDKLTPAQAAAQAVSSYREAEKFLGAPKDQLLRRPDPADPVAVKAFWQNLGKPADKTGYDFSGVKRANGEAPDAGFVACPRTSTNSGPPSSAPTWSFGSSNGLEAARQASWKALPRRQAGVAGPIHRADQLKTPAGRFAPSAAVDATSPGAGCSRRTSRSTN
jgi:hypothetical protein